MTPNDTPATVAPTTPANPADVVIETAAEIGAMLVNQGSTVRASWPFSLDIIRSNIAYMSPEARELLVWAFTWCTSLDHPIRLDEFCERVGYARNTIYKIYRGKYLHPESTDDKPRLMEAPAKLLKAIRDFKRVEISREKLGRVGFVKTPTAKRVFDACDLARKSQTPVFIYGSSQIGKTEAARQYCLENNHGKSVLVELEAVNGLKGLLQAIALKVGVSPNANTPDLIERLKRAITRDMVIILDEVHLLANVYRKGSFFACMETVRRILIDHCRCGLVLMFTLLGYTSAEKEKTRELEQIFRRGVHRINLGDRPTVADVAAIAEAWHLEMPAKHDEIVLNIGGEYREQVWVRLGQLSKEEGLKAITERLRSAAEQAADRGEEIDWKHFVLVDAMIRKNSLQPKTGWGEERAA